MDDERTFDSVSSLAVINVLSNSNIDSHYIHLIRNIYKEKKAKSKLHKTSDTVSVFSISKAVRQGNTISPKLFNAIVQEIFKKLNCNKKGIRIVGEFVNHLRFLDALARQSESE